MVAHRSNRLDGDDIEARIDKLLGEDARTGPNFQNPVRPVVIDEASQKLRWIGGSRLLVDPGVASESIFGCFVDHRQSIARSDACHQLSFDPQACRQRDFRECRCRVQRPRQPIVIRPQREPAPIWST